MIFEVFNKKNCLIFFTIVISILVFIFSFYLIKSLYFFSSKDDTISTFSSQQSEDNLYIDLNGDGKKDTIYLSSSTTNNQYVISCNINNKNYPLEVKSPLNTLGTYCSYWPIKLEFLDLSRDKIPEIIITSNENNIPIAHIFKWTGENYKDLFCSTNEILGILDSNNNRSPKLISYSLNDSKDNIQKHMIINNNIKNISYENLNVPAYDVINQFIEIITLPYNMYNLPDIFSEKFPTEIINKIDNLNKDDFYYVFQDGFFKDIDWNNNGEVTSVNWKLRFRKSSKNNKDDINLLEWNLNLKKVANKFIIDEI